MAAGKWTPVEDKKLKSLHKQGKGYDEIAKLMKRSRPSIAGRLHLMAKANGTNRPLSKNKGGGRRKAASPKGRPRVTTQTRTVQARKVGAKWKKIQANVSVRNMEAITLADAIAQVQETHRVLHSISSKLAKAFEKSIFA